MVGFRFPAKLLERICDPESSGRVIALCPNFELGSWRYRILAEHLFDWLPDVALRPDERDLLLYEPNKQLANSCRRLFDTDNPSSRGEIGEILLHALCRQEHQTVPFVSRLFYKMRTNDSVTSVDVAHMLFDEASAKLELWLGEAKLSGNMQDARYRALESIRPLWSPNFVYEMKALIGPKIEPGTPYAAALERLFREETTLDDIIDSIVIPICIAADFPETVSASRRTHDYIGAVLKELLATYKYFKDRVPNNVEFVLMLVPLDSKAKIESAVNRRVRSFLDL